jgi:hypothetical protein
VFASLFDLQQRYPFPSMEAAMNPFTPLPVVLMAWLMFVAVPEGSADNTAAAESHAVLQLLNENLDFRDFQGDMTLKEFCGILMEKLAGKGKEFPILIDLRAFRSENAKANDILDSPVRLPFYRNPIPAITALQIALSRSEHPATFLIQSGVVIITTKKQASPSPLLKQTVTAAFNNRPLADALAELSATTGASIVVDGRLGDKAKKPVTAFLKNDVTLDAALRMLTDMADLKVVFLDSGIYVTSPVAAQAMLKEMKEQQISQQKKSP